MQWRIKVQRVDEDSPLHVQTTETYEGAGYNTHDETIDTLLKEHANEPDTRIVGNGHIVYKEEAKTVHPTWYFG